MPLFSQSPQQETDEQLMAGIKQGDTSAFDALYMRYSKRLLNYFHRMLGGSDEKAQDFLQDIFLKLVEKPDLFDGPRFSTWIFTIAHNMCKNEYRRLSVRQEAATQGLIAEAMTPPSSIPDQADRRLDHQTFSRALCEALQSLGAGQRQIFLLRHQEHFSIKEISDIVGCSEGTVKSRLFYMTKKLAGKLKAFHPKAAER